MDKFHVKLMGKARRDLDEIFTKIYIEFERDTANSLLDELEEKIKTLESMPFRGSLRKIGIFANQGYRQLFVKNFSIVYKVDIQLNQVVIITIRYSKSDF